MSIAPPKILGMIRPHVDPRVLRPTVRFKRPVSEKERGGAARARREKLGPHDSARPSASGAEQSPHQESRGAVLIG